MIGGLDSDVDFMGEAGATARDDDFHLDSPGTVLVTGYASLPTLTRSNRRNIDLFVNQRYVEDRSLTYAVIQAYHTLLPVGRYPFAVIFLTTDPSQVDVNVHPQKTQVRFLEERRMFSAVQKAVRQAVIQHAPVPGARLSARPDLAGQEDKADDWATQSGWAARRTQILQAGQQHKFHLDVPPTSSAAGDDAALDGQYWDQSTPDDRSLSDDSAAGDRHRDAADGSPPVPIEEQATTLAGDPKRLPPLRVVGQVGAMYIIAEGPEGLFLIDQHAAHERILYEKFMAQRHETANGEEARQHLLEPLTLHVGHEVTGLVAQHLTELRLVGFEIEPFGGDTFLVRAVPGVLADQDPLRLLEEIVAAMASRRNLVGEELEARLVKMVCKRAAIKAGQLLSVIEMQELVRQLEECRSPRTCPHGRPTMIQLSAGELEKAFGRI